MHNLSEKIPDRETELEGIYNDFMAQAGVMPWDQDGERMNSLNPGLVSARWHLRTQYPGWDKGY